jgi:methylated-DNA-[protein]-cysteine S-methyltransferase
MTNLVASAISTTQGWVAASWDGEVLRQVSIASDTPAAALHSLNGVAEMCGEERLSPAQRTLLRRLAAAATGTADDFRDIKLDLSHLRPFARRVVQHCRKIPPGKTMSYGQLAAACGSPRAARAVGNVMRTNRYPLIVPCHRVVGSGGSLGGFSAPHGIATKQQLLAGEAAAIA